MKDQKKIFIHNGHILGLTSILFIPIAILVSKGLAPLFAIAVVSCLGLKIWRSRTFPWLPGPVIYSLLILISWSLISWLWSITPDETLKTSISLAVTLCGGTVLFSIGISFSSKEKKTLQNGMILGGLLGFSLIAFEFASNAWLAKFLLLKLALLKNPDIPSYSTFVFSVYGDSTPVMNPGMAATSLFFFPWALAIKNRFPLKIFIPTILVCAALIFITYADAIKLSFAVAIIVFFTALAWPRWFPRIMCLAITVGVLGAPLIPSLFPNPLVPSKSLEWLSPSSAHRILIWQNTARHIKQKPLLGSGLDATRGLYNSEDRVEYKFSSEVSGAEEYQVSFEPIPLHPHNAVLQVWLELGAVGALISLGLLLAILRAIYIGLSVRVERAVSIGMFTATVSLACLSFGIWQGWWLSAILLSLAYFASELSAPLVKKNTPKIEETGGPKGLDPTRYGDWEHKGRAVDF